MMRRAVFVVGVIALLLTTAFTTNAQLRPAAGSKLKISQGGLKGEVVEVDSLESTGFVVDDYDFTLADSLAADSLKLSLQEYALLMELYEYDEMRSDSLDLSKTVKDLEDSTKSMTKRELKRHQRALEDADTSFVRYSKVFRKIMPLSRMTAISFVLPGFGQLHNKQAWKVPILYATVATSTVFWQREQKKYKRYKEQYDYLVARHSPRSVIDPVQRNMIQHNTAKQVFMFGALASYIYFIGDAAVNHKGASTSVKKATTLSTIFPGAGQIYNKSYWKVPIVIGGFATMIYIIDWNNRGYKRFRTALQILNDNDDDTHTEFYYNNREQYTAEQLTNYKRSYRRNRDLSIILTGALYLFNIIDAHADAHMKDYDISDDLTMDIQPKVESFSTSKKGSTNMVGFSFTLTF